MQEIFVLTFKVYELHCVRSIRLECQNKYFLVWTSSSVNKSIRGKVKMQNLSCDCEALSLVKIKVSSSEAGSNGFIL